MTDAPPLPADEPRRPKKGTTVAVAMVIMALGIVVWFNYYIKVKSDMLKDRLPMNGRLEQDIGLTDQNRKERHLGELKGKVFIVGWLYTTCPRGCAGLAVEMSELQKEFGSNPKFAMVSVSLDPTRDTPDVLKNWTAAHGFGGDNWWFVTGDEKEIVPYMQNFLGLWRKEVPAKERVGPEDNWVHPVAFRLVDHKGNVRGDLYYPNHPAFQGRYMPHDIRQDIEKLLAEAEKEN